MYFNTVQQSTLQSVQNRQSSLYSTNSREFPFYVLTGVLSILLAVLLLMQFLEQAEPAVSKPVKLRSIDTLDTLVAQAEAKLLFASLEERCHGVHYPDDNAPLRRRPAPGSEDMQKWHKTLSTHFNPRLFPKLSAAQPEMSASVTWQ